MWKMSDIKAPSDTIMHTRKGYFDFGIKSMFQSIKTLYCVNLNDAVIFINISSCGTVSLL
jgi:hypothetical protein